MVTKNYKGKVYLKKSGHMVEVNCCATSPSAAKKIIQSMYDIKSFAKQMSTK